MQGRRLTATGYGSRGVVTSITDNMTACFWIRSVEAQTSAQYHWIVSHGTPAASNGWSAGLLSDAGGYSNKVAWVAHGNGLSNGTADVRCDGLWHHITVARVSTTWTTWIDGRNRETSGTTAPGASTGSSYINRTATDATNGWRGAVFDIAQFPRVLEQWEIDQLVAGYARPGGLRGKPTFWLPMSEPPGHTELEDYYSAFDFSVAGDVRAWAESGPGSFLMGALEIAAGDSISVGFISAATVLYQPITPYDMAVGFISSATVMYSPASIEVEVDRTLSFISAQTIVVSPKLAAEIVNVTLPQISGTATEGLVVTCSTGTWLGTPPLTFAYQWRLCDSGGGSCANIAGATNPAYIVQAADVGGTLRCVVTASDS